MANLYLLVNRASVSRMQLLNLKLFSAFIFAENAPGPQKREKNVHHSFFFSLMHIVYIISDYNQ